MATIFWPITSCSHAKPKQLGNYFRHSFENHSIYVCKKVIQHSSITSVSVTSASTYWTPFWMIDTKAPGGTTDPLMFDWSMWLSTPNVNAECWNPNGIKNTHDQEKLMRNIIIKFIHMIKRNSWEILLQNSYTWSRETREKYYYKNSLTIQNKNIKEMKILWRF